MKRARDDEQGRLLALARSQVIADPDVVLCWQYVIEGIRKNWLGMPNLPELASALGRGGARGYQELDFDPADEDRSILVVSFVDGEYRCSLDAMIAELQRLIRRFRGEPDPVGGTPESAANGSSSAGSGGDTALDVLAEALGTTVADLSHGQTPGQGAELAELQRELESIVLALTQGDADARARAGSLHRALSERGVVATRLPDAGELGSRISRALTSGALDTRHMGQTLRILSGWLRGEETSGQEIARVVERLQRTVGPLIGDTRGEREATTDARIRGAARTAIQARMAPIGATDAKTQRRR